jgi:hypothetical protein
MNSLLKINENQNISSDETLNSNDILKILNIINNEFKNKFNSIEKLDTDKIYNNLKIINDYSEKFNEDYDKWFDQNFYDQQQDLLKKINLIDDNTNTYYNNSIIKIKLD